MLLVVATSAKITHFKEGQPFSHLTMIMLEGINKSSSITTYGSRINQQTPVCMMPTFVNAAGDVTQIACSQTESKHRGTIDEC